MTPEDVLKNSIMLEAGKRGFICLRLNSGKAWNGRMVRIVFGEWKGHTAIIDPRPIQLCPEGTSDMLFVMPDGRYCFVESKVHPRKATSQQINFINIVRSLGGIAGVCYSVQEFIDLISSS